MEYVEVGKLLAEIGVSTGLTAAVIYLLIRYFTKLIDYKFKEKGTIVDNEHIEYGSVKVLKEAHPIFNKLEDIINIKLPIVHIGGPVRTTIFRDVLKIFYRCQMNLIRQLLEQPITEDNFLSLNSKIANKFITDADKEMEEFGVPEIVRTKFWEWNYKRHEYTMTTLSDIDSSNVFKTAVEKQYAALNLYQSYAYFILIDAENTLTTLNGELTGTIYKGAVVENLHEGV